MNRFFLAFVPFLLIHCAAPQKDVALDLSKEQEAIDALLTGWHDAAATADEAAYWSAMDSVSIFYGTDATEYWTKDQFKEFAGPVFARGRGWDFDAINRHIYFGESGDVAWFDEQLNTWMGVCIGSGVLERKGADWKIKHYVLSVLVPNDDIEPVLEIKRARDSVYITSMGHDLKVR